MNSTFDLNRFWKLVKTETLINKSTIIKLLLGWLLLVLLVYYYHSRIFIYMIPDVNQDTIFVVHDYTEILILVIIIVPLSLHYNVYHKVKNASYAMLPASQLEKVISAIIQTSILIPALLLAVLVLFMLILRSVNPNLEIEIIYREIFTAIQIQSFLFLGMFWFRKNKILKMTLIIIVVTVLIITTAYWIFHISPQGDLYYFLFNFTTKFKDVITFISEHKNIILAIFFPLLPYTIAFLKYRRTQI